jgi:hypothetical protein
MQTDFVRRTIFSQKNHAPLATIFVPIALRAVSTLGSEL